MIGGTNTIGREETSGAALVDNERLFVWRIGDEKISYGIKMAKWPPACS